jgi:hypothetical protein
MNSNDNLFDDPAAEPPTHETDNSDSPNPERKKRNSGRTGPTSAEGKAKSAANALKHGACATTLILPQESEFGWEILKSRWEDAYKPRPESLEADFVLRTAQAEWYRLRCQRQFNEFIMSINGKAAFLWTPEETKTHDLMLRYKNNAERAFQRECRLLEAHYKAHKLSRASDEPNYDDCPPPPIVRCGTAEEVREIIRRKHSPIYEDPLYYPSRNTSQPPTSPDSESESGPEA